MLKNLFKTVAYLFVVVGFSCATAGSYEDFFTAIKRDDALTIRQLVARGFDVNSRDPQDQPGLFLALKGESLKAAEAIATSPGVDLNAANSVGETPLMIAAIGGRIDWCERLLNAGASVNKNGWAPLHYAASSSQPDVVKLLLQRGAAIEAESPNRSTPLMLAAGYGAEGNVDVLIAAGADPKRRNDLSLTAGDFAQRAERTALAQKLQNLTR